MDYELLRGLYDGPSVSLPREYKIEMKHMLFYNRLGNCCFIWWAPGRLGDTKLDVEQMIGKRHPHFRR